MHYSVQNLEVVNVPPVMKVYQIPNGDYLYITTALKVISVTPDGKLSGQLRKVRDESDKSMTIFDARRHRGCPVLRRQPLCHCR